MGPKPRKIGKYSVISKLAAGGMGEVYKAEHPTLGITVIVKSLTIKDHPAIAERFRREARIMMDLVDEHIVQVYDHFKRGDSYCIAMEYVEGTDLQNLLQKRHHLPNDVALLIFAEVCRTLKYAHARKVIHRDIKPGNILISNNGQVKLTDFGVAASLEQKEDLTGEGMTLGTPAFMAPEQITDPRNVDQRADIYSAGVVFYVMVTGQKPYKGRFTAEVAGRASKGKYVRPRKLNPDVLPSIQRIIKKSMHHKHKRRYKNAEVVLKKCAKLLKLYPDQESINNKIREFLENEDYVDQQTLKAESGRFKRRLAFASALTAFLLLLLATAFGFWKGLHYEFFYPEEYGALKIETHMRKSPRIGGEGYIMCSLFQRKSEKWLPVKKMNMGFSKEGATIGERFDLFRSRKVYLPKGQYLARLDLENEQYQRQFFLPSLSIQRQQPRWRDGYLIRIGMEKKAPPLPLKFDFVVRNILGNQNITDESEVAIFYRNRWVPWGNFARDEASSLWFTSGKAYSFQVSTPGFFPRKINVSVGEDQTVLRLDATMTPKPGQLFLQSEPSGMICLLNNMSDYLEGGTEPAYKKLGYLSEKGEQISLPAGEYFLTVKEEKPWWKRLSLFPPEIVPVRSNTQKITIRAGETLQAKARFDPSSGTLILAIN